MIRATLETLTDDFYVTQSGFEVDFVVPPSGQDDRKLIQACWSLDDPATRDRELRGLRAAMQELRVPRGAIVTWLDEDQSDDRIAVMPAWKWLLHDAPEPT